jgi:hypothetical protein
MRVVLQGSVRHFAAGELLALLGKSSHTGTFDAESGEKRLRLFIREGKIAWAEGSSGGDANSLITDFVTWTDGSFTFLDDLSLPEVVTPLQLDPTEVVAAAEKRIAETKRVLELFPDEQTVFRIVPMPKGDMISLRPEELQVLLAISAGRSLAQLRNDTRKHPLELYPIVNALQSGGLIEAANSFDPDATERPAAAPRPKSLSKRKSAAVHLATAIGTLTTVDGMMNPLMEDESSIGRVAGNAVVLPDSSVSSKHARVSRSAEGFTLEDLGSRNGTFVNGERVSEKRPLADGDVVRFGKVLLTFNVAAETRPKDSTQPEVPVPKPK